MQIFKSVQEVEKHLPFSFKALRLFLKKYGSIRVVPLEDFLHRIWDNDDKNESKNVWIFFAVRSLLLIVSGHIKQL